MKIMKLNKFKKWWHEPITIESNRIICGIVSLGSFLLTCTLIPIFPSDKIGRLIIVALFIAIVPIVYGWYVELILKNKNKS